MQGQSSSIRVFWWRDGDIIFAAPDAAEEAPFNVTAGAWTMRLAVASRQSWLYDRDFVPPPDRTADRELPYTAAQATDETATYLVFLQDDDSRVAATLLNTYIDVGTGDDVYIYAGETAEIGGADAITNGSGATTVEWTQGGVSGGAFASSTSATTTFTAGYEEGDAWLQKAVTNNGITYVSAIRAVIGPSREAFRINKTGELTICWPGRPAVLSGQDEVVDESRVGVLTYKWVFSRRNDRLTNFTFNGNNFENDNFMGSLRAPQSVEFPDNDNPITVPDAPVPTTNFYASGSDGPVTIDTSVPRNQASITLTPILNPGTASPTTMGGSMWWRKFVYSDGHAIAAWDYLVVYVAANVAAPGRVVDFIHTPRLQTVTIAEVTSFVDGFNPGGNFAIRDVRAVIEEISGTGPISVTPVDYVDWDTAVESGFQVEINVGEGVENLRLSITYTVYFRLPSLDMNLAGETISVQFDFSEIEGIRPWRAWRNNVIVGTGEVFLDARAGRNLVDRAGESALTGERYLGAVTAVTIATTTDTLRVLSGSQAMARLLASSIIRVTRVLQIEIQDMAMDTVALAALAASPTDRIEAAGALSETIVATTLNRWYQLSAPLGPGPITGLDVQESGSSLAHGVDYQADLRRGRIFVKAGGAASAGDSLAVTATKTGRNTRCVEAKVEETPLAAVRYIEDSAHGVAGRDWYFPICALLDGGINLMARDREQRVTTTWAVLKGPGGGSDIYVDGEELAQPGFGGVATT